MVYELVLYKDKPPKEKYEYTYDENNCIEIRSIYKDGIWTYQTKRECTIGGDLKECSCENGEWVLQN